MGDQPTAETQNPSQSPLETPITQSEPQSSPDQITLIPPPTVQISQNPSKIPIRPQKIRKLSTPTTEDSSSSALSLVPSTATPTSQYTGKPRRRNANQTSRALPKVIKLLTAEGELDLALRHLRTADPLLIPLIETFQAPKFESHHPPFLALSKSIIYQQLAYKAGTSIYNRFIGLCGGEEAVQPDTVLALNSEQLRQIGVSGRKATYLYDLANKYKSGILSDDLVVKMDDRSLFTMLSLVKGIGSWSVHMFMLFSLQRPDVLPVSDIEVRKGVQLLYGLDEMPRPSQMEHLCQKWRPYRSVGAWYMWRLTESKGGSVPGTLVQQILPPQDGQQQQHQLQFVEPVNGIGNIGTCVWNEG